MNKVYLLIGGNMGDRMANLNTAIQWLESEAGVVKAKSAIYETAAWGNTNQPHFLNQALYLETNMQAGELMNALLAIEKKMGRSRAIPMGPRTIDIDIIYFNSDIINTNNLIIPHPRIQDRKFVLLPLVEISPSYLHPILNKTNAILLKECGDSLAVYKKTDL